MPGYNSRNMKLSSKDHPKIAPAEKYNKAAHCFIQEDYEKDFQ